MAATEAGVHFFWGEPVEDIWERIGRPRHLSRTLKRDPPSPAFGLPIIPLVRDTSEDAEAEVAGMARDKGHGLRRPGERHGPRRRA